jgi:hypothetical protein
MAFAGEVVDVCRCRFRGGLMPSSMSGVWRPFWFEDATVCAKRESDRVVRRGGDVGVTDAWLKSLDVSFDTREDRISRFEA